MCTIRILEAFLKFILYCRIYILPCFSKIFGRCFTLLKESYLIPMYDTFLFLLITNQREESESLKGSLLTAVIQQFQG